MTAFAQVITEAPQKFKKVEYKCTGVSGIRTGLVRTLLRIKAI